MPRRDDGSICYSDTHYRDTWRAMEKLVDKGLVKAIGLSNFNARQIDDIISIARHKPVVNQVKPDICGTINLDVNQSRQTNMLLRATRPVGGLKESQTFIAENVLYVTYW